MNELSLETSPYLLQHAQNPVHWKAWNAASLAAAKSRNRLIIVSIGYSACHWCHVMEHETFENEQAARVMNAHFINIKVDREERPDVDAVYMKAIQVMTGHGGWPLNVVALPDGRPVWGGTYFRREEWIATLDQLQDLYQTNPGKMTEYAEKLHAGLESLNLIRPKNTETPWSREILESLVLKWKKSFDQEFGGMARAPKFMMPNNYKFLLRYAYENNDAELLGFINLTLAKMAHGGLFDTVGGGFSRYSVDMKWHVPHFEKMLYDNGQLVSLYADAYKLTGNPLYKETAAKTLDFISRELTGENGGFYCALDADSLNESGHLEEGAFYVWKKDSLEQLIGEDFGLFSEAFNINDFGHWEDGNYVLIQNNALETIAENNHISVSSLKEKKQAWEKTLLSEREKRSRPRLDDKCLASWNAIMLKGFIDAYKAFAQPEYLEKAVKNAGFILENFYSPEGNLYHSHKNGKSTINGYLEDYCFTIESFIALYEVTFQEKWLRQAKELTDYALDHFYDRQHAFFTFASDLDDPLITRHFETEDNVIPASNSVMAENLYRLGVYFENPFYGKILEEMLGKIIPEIDYPSAFSNWLYVSMNFSGHNRELAISGCGALEYAALFNREYHPDILLAGTTSHSALPFLKDRAAHNKTLFFLCRDKTCELPTEDFEEIRKKITLF